MGQWTERGQMADQEIRDSRGLLVAKIKTLSDGRQEIRDSRGIVRGKYNPKNNETRDDRGMLVAKGNVLTSLIRPF